MSAEKDLSGKVAIVTGGSRGIGKAVAEKLAEHGANVVISSTKTSEPKAQEVLREIKKWGQAGLWIPGDLSQEEAGANLVEQTIQAFNRVDILVHSAGITDDSLFTRMTGERWRRVIDTNLNSAFYVSQPAMRQMIRQREGTMIFISSVSAHGNAGQASYAASKAGIEGFMRTLAEECMSEKRPIRVNAIACGLVNTEMAQRLSDEQRAKIIARSPLGRIIEPNEVAEVVTFLVSSKASAVNGIVMDIDGGMLRR